LNGLECQRQPVQSVILATAKLLVNFPVMSP